MENLLITGGAGFIGSNFVHYVLDRYPGYRIVVFDKLTYAGNLDNLKDVTERFAARYEFVRGDIARQTEVCLDHVKASLEAAGSSLDKVLKMTVYASNSAYYGSINEVYARYFDENPPARTFVTVASWPMEFDIEIECIALA